MQCVACAADVPASAKFCLRCGQPQQVSCSSCGTGLPGDARFCGSCGTPVSGAAAAAVTPAREPSADGAVPSAGAVSERRVCSVLFADLVGFTPLSESRDAEEVRELLSRYFDVARTVVQRYGGVVEKFIGDAVMAVWGTPVASEGDAERAVRAGLELVDAVAALGAEVGVVGLAARAGVVTGEVAVTVGAVGEGMVAGDAVNTAARVQSAAVPGAVLVDEATRRVAGAGIGFDDAGEHTLKGKAEPAHLWRATRVLAGVGGSQRVDGLEAGLIGRDAELRLIKELFHAAADRRSPRMLVLAGAAGVGKSRLGWEFEKYVDGLAQVVMWHRGRCLSYGEGVAFWALAEAVRQRLGIAEEDPTAVAAVKLSEALPGLITDPSEREYVGVRLGRLLGVPAEGDTGAPLSRQELFAGWRLFFERLAATQPVVLLIEDAQYADPGLLDFLDHLVDWSRDLPVFVLVLSRPELEERRAGFGVGRNRTVLTLDPLDAVSMDSLVDALVPGMPAAARTAITAHAQGVPLFAVETVRSLVDRDVVQPVEGVYRLLGDVGELSVPDSLHSLLAARLDALDAALRGLVADAAVLGGSFPAEAVIAVSAQPESDVRSGLAELLRREVLEVSADPLSPQRGEYRFSQQLLRQVAYDTLSRRDRKSRHLKVASHLRATFPDDGEEVADVVARHYRDALSAVPDDADVAEIRQEAARMSVRAAERAERAGAPATAATSFAIAAELVADGDGGTAAGWWERAAAAAVLAADYEPALRYAEQARVGYVDAGRRRDGARVQAVAAQALRMAGRYTAARQEVTAALDVLRDAADEDTVVALEQLATIESFEGGPDADRLTAEALQLGQELDVGDARLARLFIGRGVAHSVAGRNAEAAACFEYAARVAERAGAIAPRGTALLNLADVLARFDPPAAAETARAAADLLRLVGAREFLAIALGNLVEALITTGDWQRADLAVTEDAVADGVDDHPFIRLNVAWLSALKGDGDVAASLVSGIEPMRATEDAQVLAVFDNVEAFIAVAAGDHEAALRHALSVLEHADVIGIYAESVRAAWPVAARAAHELSDEATERRLLAVLDAHPIGHLPTILRAEREIARARLADDPSDKAAHFDAGIAALRRMGAAHALAHALLDRASALDDGQDNATAGAAVREAAEIAERLGARPLAARADALRRLPV